MSLSIKSKFRLLFAALIVGAALSSWLMVGRLAVVYDDAAHISETLVPRRGTIYEAMLEAAGYRLAETRHMLSIDEQSIAAEERALKSSNDAMLGHLSRVRSLITAEADRSELDHLQAAWQSYVEGEQPLLAASRKNDNQTAFQLFRQTRQRYTEIRQEMDRAVQRCSEEIAQAKQHSGAVYSGVVHSVIVAMIIILVLAIAAAVYFERISHAILSLRMRMGRLAQGDLSVELPDAARHDELGAMAQTVQTFKDNALAVQRLEAQANQNRLKTEAEQAAALTEREAAAARLATVVEALANGLAHLAQGDLTVALTTSFAPEYERLRADFNAAITGLQDAIKDIASHSEAISTGTSQIAHATDDLAKRTEQQAASLEQTAAALDEITATVQNTAIGSMKAQGIADGTRSEAEVSARVVNETVTAMGEIENSARLISQIIGVIDEIAFQTNLLALNAGVEAARAGEAGRGFAVVASEVRALAQRAADAAKEIKALISTSMQHVERGVMLVGATGEALGRIQNGVRDITASITEIAASAREQANGLAEVNTAINQMDQVTQQNAAMVEQSTAAAHSLSHETQAMSKAMGRFRTHVRPAALVGPQTRRAG